MYQNPELSAFQASEPPAVGYCARGTASPVSLPVATSNTCTVPSSLPLRDSETATRFPSGDGTNQSIAVWPDGSSVLGSTTGRTCDGSAEAGITVTIGCCFGGCTVSVNSRPPAMVSEW